jgi:hypothetical protein
LSGVDALGSRLAFSAGAAGFGALSGDVVFNVRSGELSFFVSPEAGVLLGGSMSLVGGMTFLRKLPSNESFRGTFMAVGLVGGDVAGLDVEAFWTSPMSDQFGAFDKAHGAFFGVGPGVQLGVYDSLSYSFELYREDVSGSHWLPHPPNPLTVAQDIGSAFIRDILLHPMWPWSPYR